MHEIFDRNIRNSLLVTGGEFESALADIIEQLENPPTLEGRHLAAWEMARMIAEAMGEGFAGLPPNGFDFACWLWETAPLHVVRIPHANSIGTAHGFRYGVAHQRKIAAMIAGAYLLQQPLKAAPIIELIDMSLDWVDARNLILYALLEHYDQYFQQEYETLEQLASSPKPWRRLIPPGIAARVIGTRHEDSAAAYALLSRATPHVGDPHMYHALQYVLRIAGMYGSRSELIGFLVSLRESSEPELHKLVCDFLSNPRLKWETASRRQVIDILDGWSSRSVKAERIPCLDSTLAKLKALPASA